MQVVNRLHTENPLMTNHDSARVFAQLEYIGDHLILEAVVNRLLKSKQLVGDRKRIASAEFKPKLSANQRKLKARVIESHLQAGFTPPEPLSFAPQAGGNTANLKDIFEVAVAEGHLVKISEEIYLHQETEAQMRHRMMEKLHSGIAGLTVAEIRDLLGTTRKFAIPLCEYLDRIGVTCREGDLRVRGAQLKNLTESVQ